MKLKLFKDGTAMFVDRTPMHDVIIEVNGSGYLHVGDRVYPIKDGAAYVGELPQGEYDISVVGKSKIHHARERLIETEAGMACVDDSHLWELVLDSKNRIDELTEILKTLRKQVNEHEEQISGFSLFGEDE